MKELGMLAHLVDKENFDKIYGQINKTSEGLAKNQKHSSASANLDSTTETAMKTITEDVVERGENISDSSIVLEKDENKYPYDQQEVIEGYEGAVDKSTIDYVNSVRNMKDNDAKNRRRFVVGNVSERFKNDVKRITGIDFDGDKHVLRGSTVVHIDNRHGKNGEQDHSMSHDEDIGRIGWVIENYDTMELVLDKDGNPDIDLENRNYDDSASPIIRISKKINGTYYVVEAVPDSSARTAFIKSAYISKKDSGENSDPLPNMAHDTPQPTSETNDGDGKTTPIGSPSRWNSSATENSLSHSGVIVNSDFVGDLGENPVKVAETKATEAAYEAGRANVPRESVTLETPEQEIAYNEGRIEYIKNMNSENLQNDADNSVNKEYTQSETIDGESNTISVARRTGEGIKKSSGVVVGEDTGYSLAAVEVVDKGGNKKTVIVETTSGLEFGAGATVSEALSNARENIKVAGRERIDTIISERNLSGAEMQINVGAENTTPVRGNTLSVGRAVSEADYTNTLLELARTSNDETIRRAADKYALNDFKNDEQRYRLLGDIAKRLGVTEGDLVKSRAKSLLGKIVNSISGTDNIVDKISSGIEFETEAARNRGDTATLAALDYLERLIESEGSVISVSEMFVANEYASDNRNTAVEVYGERMETAFKSLGLDISVSVYYDSSENAPRGEWSKDANGRSVITLNGSKLQGEQSAFWVLSHELFHEAEAKSAGITNRVLEVFAEMGMYNEKQFEAYKERYRPQYEKLYKGMLDSGKITQEEYDSLVRDYVNEEIVSDLMCETMGSTELLEMFTGKLSKRDANVILSFFKRMLGGIKRVFNSKDAFTNKFEGIVAEFEGALKNNVDGASNERYTKDKRYAVLPRPNEGVEWARGILEDSEITQFYSNIADLKKLKFNFPKAGDGSYVFETDKSLILTDGKWVKPTIRYVFTIKDKNNTTKIKEYLYDWIKEPFESNAFGRSCEEAVYLTNIIFGDESVTFGTIEDNKKVFSEQNRRGERTDSGNTDSGTSENGKNQVNKKFALSGNTGSGNGHNGRTKMTLSSDKWVPKIGKARLEKLKARVKSDIRTSQNEITETANWIYREIDGAKVFAIYSTEVFDDPTILYVSKDDTASFECALIQYIEEEFKLEQGRNNVTESEIVAKVLSGSWMSQINSLQNQLDHLGRNSGASYVAILQRTSKRKPRAAFRSVLENLFGIPNDGRGRVEKRFALSGNGFDSEAVSGYNKNTLDSVSYEKRYSELSPEEHTLYDAAKKGDTASAFSLIDSLLENRKTNSVDFSKLDKDILLLPIIGVDGTSKNVMPSNIAEHISDIYGFKIFYGIFKSTESDSRKMSVWERMKENYPSFKFDKQSIVQTLKDKTFILIDDNSTTGRTFNGLKNFVEENGGTVAGYYALTVGQDASEKMTVSEDTWKEATKIGVDKLKQFAKEEGVIREISKQGLTERECQELINKYRKSEISDTGRGSQTDRGSEGGRKELSSISSQDGETGALQETSGLERSESISHENKDIRYSLDDTGVFSLEDALNEKIENYGAIPAGEKPSRDVQVPRKTSKDKKVSQTVRTILEAKATPDEAVPTIEKMVVDGVFSYDNLILQNKSGAVHTRLRFVLSCISSCICI